MGGLRLAPTPAAAYDAPVATADSATSNAQPDELLRPLAGAFAGLRVLDFTQNLPGPYCTMLLAALGADVVKVEPPRGDPARLIGKLFDHLNQRKASVVLDLKRDQDRERMLALASEADVVVEGFRPGVMARFGADAAALQASNPKLVYCSISGFGQRGPYADRPAHDLNYQALTGVCHMMRDADGRPRGAALPLADLSGSMTAFGAIAAALYARERDGVGRYLDVTLADTLLSWAHLWSDGLTPQKLGMGAGANAAAAWVHELGDKAPAPLRPVTQWIEKQLAKPGVHDSVERLGERLAASEHYERLTRVGLHALPHYGIYETRDHQWLSVGIVDEQKFWAALCSALGLKPLAALPLPARFLAGPPLRKAMAAIFARHDMAHWLAHLDPTQIPVAPVVPLSEALEDPHLRGRLGAQVAGGPPPLRLEPGGQAPKLGADTERIVDAWLGA